MGTLVKRDENGARSNANSGDSCKPNDPRLEIPRIKEKATDNSVAGVQNASVWAIVYALTGAAGPHGTQEILKEWPYCCVR